MESSISGSGSDETVIKLTFKTNLDKTWAFLKKEN